MTGAGVPTFDGTYILSSNSAVGVDEYSNFTIVSSLTAAAFDIEITSPDGGRGAIPGFQIVANPEVVPEPSSLIALSTIGIGLMVRRRRFSN